MSVLNTHGMRYVSKLTSDGLGLVPLWAYDVFINHHALCILLYVKHFCKSTWTADQSE